MALIEGMEALARAVARSRARDETPRLMWGQVDAAGPPAQVVLDGDQSGESRPVSGSAVGPVAAGQRVLLARQGRRLWIINAPAPRPLSGVVTVTTGADWTTVDLPVGHFTAPPVVVVSVADGSAPNRLGVTVRTGSIGSLHSFRVQALRSGTMSTDGPVNVAWIAVQP